MIVGNHDAVYRNTNELNSVYLLTQEYPNIIEYHQPTEINIGGCEMLIVPWICKDNEKQSYQMIKGTTAQIVMGHLELKGFQMNKGYVVQEGADHTIYDKFDMVCTGHYHHKSTEKNINYLGSPYEMTWMDYEDPKGFHIFDTETRELTRVVNPNRMFYKLWYNDTNLTFEEVMAMDFTPYQNAYVKVIVSNKTNPYLFDTYVDKGTLLHNYAHIFELLSRLRQCTDHVCFTFFQIRNFFRTKFCT